MQKVALAFFLVVVLLVGGRPVRAGDAFDSSTYLDDCSYGDPKSVKDVPTIKEWSLAEKSEFELCLHTLESSALLAFATRNHHVEWYRATELGPNVIAETVHGRIFVSDAFFNESGIEQVGIIIHELAHVIDDGHRYSWSKDWCKIVGPRIAKFRKLVDCSKTPGDNIVDSPESTKVAQSCGLPRSYAATDPSESFACFVEYMLGYGLADTEVSQYFDSHIPLLTGANSGDLFDNPVEDRDPVEDAVCEGERLLQQGAYDGALKAFSAALASNELLPAVHAGIATIWLKRSELEMAVSHCRTQVQQFKGLGVPRECRGSFAAVLSLIVNDMRLRKKDDPTLVSGHYTDDGTFTGASRSPVPLSNGRKGQGKVSVPSEEKRQKR